MIKKFCSCLSFQKIIFSKITFILTILVLLVPYIVAPHLYFPFITGKVFYFYALVLILLAVFFLHRIWKGGCLVRINLLFGVIFIFVLANFLSAIFGENFSRSFWGNLGRGTSFLFLLFCFLFFSIISTVFDKRSYWMKLFLIASLVSVSIASMTIVEKLTGIEIISGGQGGVTFGNTSFLATYLLLGTFIILLVIFEFGKEKEELGFVFLDRKDVVILGTLFLAVNLLALYLSHGRAACISTFLGLSLFYVLYLVFYQEDGFLQRTAKVVLIAGIVIFLFFAINLQVPNSIAQRIFSYLNLNRVLVWQSSALMLKERPIFGWGENNYELAFNKYLNPKMYILEETRFDKPHNVIWEILVANGIVGLITFLGIYWVMFYYLWKLYKQQKISFFVSAVLTSLFVAHFIQNLTIFDTPTSYIYLFFLFGFISFLIPSRKIKINSFSNKTKIIFSALVVIITVSIGYFVVYLPYLSARYIIMASRCSVTQIHARAKLYHKAIFLSPMGKYNKREYFAQFVNNNFDKLSQEERKTAIQELRKTIQEEPLDFFAYYLLVQIYNKYGERYDQTKLKQAREIGERAIALFPNHLYGYFVLAKTYKLLGEKTQSLELLLKAIKIEPQYYYSYYHALQNLKNDKDKEQIEKILQLAQSNIPQYFARLVEDLEKEGLDLTQFLE